MQIMYGLHMEIMIKYIYEEKKLVFLAFATIAIALLLEAGILKYVNDSNTYRMSKYCWIVLSPCSIKMMIVKMDSSNR